MKKVLIFGASGQIGRYLIRKLTKNNYTVTAVTRNSHRKGYILKTQANAGYLNIVESSSLSERLNIKSLLNRKTGQLSAVQKTRVALAKALSNDPQLLFLDEPTASLDPDTADWIRSYLQEYAVQKRATILLASHHMGEVERLSNNVFMLQEGKIVDSGTPKELVKRYGRSNMEEVFLDVARGRQIDNTAEN